MPLLPHSAAQSSVSNPELPPPAISAETAARLLAFRDARRWAPKHNPKDLAASIVIEAAELLEIFQWSGDDLECRDKHEQMEDELADVFAYALLLADRIGASPDQMLLKKLEKLDKKSPAEVCRRDPLLETYETLKTAERTRREMLEDPQLQRVLGFLDFLHEHSVGAWTSASDGRVFFVAYDRAAVNFWQGVEDWTSHFPAKMLENALPENFAARPSAKDIAELSFAGAAALLKKIVREERIHDGAFLSAAESGLLKCVLERLQTFAEP